MDQGLNRADTHFQLSSNFFIRRETLRIDGVQECSQRLEDGCFPLGSVFAVEAVQGLADQRNRPPGIKDLFGAERIDQLQPVPIFRSFRIEMDKLRLPAAFEAARSIRLVRKKLLQGCQQKRPELTLRSIHPTQGLMFNQVKKKTLDQILRVFGRIPAMPDKGIQRVPIEFAKIAESFLGAGRLALR